MRWPSVEVDAAGSVILGAHFIGAIDLGAGPIPEDEEAVGRWRVFLAKYDGPCALAWDVVISGDGEIQDLASTPDADGGVIAAGSFFGTLDFGGTTLEATYGIEAVADVLYQTTDLFVARYSPEGALLWARRFGDDAYQRAHDVAITDADEVIVVGGVRGTVDLGNDVIIADERYDGLLAQFTADGEHAWHHTFSAPADVGIFAVDVSAGGLLSISGLAASGVDFGGGPLDVVDETYEYLAQFEPSGEHRWSRRNLPGYEPHGLLADDDGAVYSAGTTKYVQDTPRDAFVIRFDDAGELAWSRESATDGRAEGSDVALAPGGGVELAGFFEGTIDLGGGPATAANFATDLFYARVTPKGDVSATTQLGVESYAEVRPRAHRIGPAGQRVTVGTFTGTVDFGAGPMTSGDEGEVFLRVAP
ncbi:MAG: hypothetical protein KC486_17725 [Myxococcales bacterium]|nr:hypothetical protein [Myxococcales bacterium]